MKIEVIKLEKIEQNENSRVAYKQADLSELMLSLKKDGLLQPIGVRKISSGKYEAVWGNRRLIAAKKLGWTEIDAHVFEVENDNERDFIGLIENFKRQNTVVSEDGRIFQLFKDRGLSESEISARLDISETRVKFALDVLGDGVPEEYKKKIVYSARGDNKRKVKDTVTASTALAILNIRKTTNLNRAQMRSMFSYAAENKPSIDQLNKVAPLVKTGFTIEEAIEKVAGLQRITLTVFIPEKTVEKLEKKHGKKIHAVLRDVLESQKDLRVESYEGSNNMFRKKRPTDTTSTPVHGA